MHRLLLNCSLIAWRCVFDFARFLLNFPNFKNQKWECFGRIEDHGSNTVLHSEEWLVRFSEMEAKTKIFGTKNQQISELFWLKTGKSTWTLFFLRSLCSMCWCGASAFWFCALCCFVLSNSNESVIWAIKMLKNLELFQFRRPLDALTFSKLLQCKLERNFERIELFSFPRHSC